MNWAIDIRKITMRKEFRSSRGTDNVFIHLWVKILLLAGCQVFYHQGQKFFSKYYFRENAMTFCFFMLTTPSVRTRSQAVAIGLAPVPNSLWGHTLTFQHVQKTHILFRNHKCTKLLKILHIAGKKRLRKPTSKVKNNYKFPNASLIQIKQD